MKKTLILFLVLTTGYIYAQDNALQLQTVNTLIRDGKLEDAAKLLHDIESRMDENTGVLYARTLNARGTLNMNMGRNDLAQEYLAKALAVWEQNDLSNSLDAAETQVVLGNLFRVMGKYTQAEEQLNMALITRRSHLPEKHESIAAIYNDLGLVYSTADADKALTFYEKALDLYIQLFGKDDTRIAIAKTNAGYLYSRLELYGDAINNLESALEIWSKVYPAAHPSKAFVLYNLGQTYERMKNFPNARTYYEKAIGMYRENYGTKHPDISRVYNSLGNLAAAENRFTEALAFFQQALIANQREFTDTDIHSNPPTENYYDGNVLLYSMLFKAQALENQYFRKTLRFKDLLLAIKTLGSCDVLIDRLRQHIANESDKISLGAIASEVYADGVRISMAAATAALEKRPFREKAFFFSEKSKAAVLLGAISDANAKTFAGIPPQLLEEEKQMKASIALVSRQLAQKPDAESEKMLREKFYSLNRGYEIFIARLEKEYPAYYNLKFNAASPGILDLQRVISPGTMVISYFIDDKFNRLYTFQITNASFSVSEHPLTRDFDRNIRAFRNSMLFSEIATFRAAAGFLSGILLPKKINNQISNLIIIPAGRIGTLPFEALITRPAEKNSSFSTLPYLVNRFSVRYQFSSSLIINQNQNLKAASEAVLLCAPVRFTQTQNMPDLPGTEAEILEIKNLFDKKQLPNLLLLQSAADEHRLKAENLRQYRYVHFATHGVVDETTPELSRIFLNNSEGSEDGYLYAGEIYNLELNAELVTLSACETGLGKISRGEGVIGLSRALVYAGAKNCMVSFWKVSDESTAILMTGYYRELLSQNDKKFANVLQHVKKQMILSNRFASPYYWAPFILIGN